MRDLPAAVLTATIWVYWLTVGVMIVRVQRRDRGRAGVVPRQRIEQFMWLVWVPLVIAWLVLPYLAATRTSVPWAIPDFAQQPGFAMLRWIAATIGVICFALTLECWRRMGKSWRMAVVPGERTELVTGGFYRYVQHPIYALSILFMICSAIVVPTPPMFIVAVIHIALMVLKTRNEETFLLAVHGEAYAAYRARTGRFLPRFGNRTSEITRPR
jgi:protein-S-isoprenylcysteine O-methyltransferase Ste14